MKSSVIRGQLKNPHQFSANANRLCITSEYNLRRERENSWEAAPQKQDKRCEVIYCSIQRQQTSTYLLSRRVVDNREMLISPNAQNCKATTGYLSVEYTPFCPSLIEPFLDLFSSHGGRQPL
ncbi:hypothetical protein NC652_011532 [Populus alba x Populus x berolinensis]|nr:hypothetical protein NC652_011532 [Populus alba x Populus x berolinensis]